MRPLLTRLALSLLSGVMLFLSVPTFGLWPLMWVALVPQIAVALDATTHKRAFLYGWLTGTVANAVAFSLSPAPRPGRVRFRWPASATPVVPICFPFRHAFILRFVPCHPPTNSLRDAATWALGVQGSRRVPETPNSGLFGHAAPCRVRDAGSGFGLSRR